MPSALYVQGHHDGATAALDAVRAYLDQLPQVYRGAQHRQAIDHVREALPGIERRLTRRERIKT